jgi:hypothetical protein
MVGTLRHELAVTDVVIAATRLREANPRFTLVDRVSEQEFRHRPGYTQLDYETVAVQPDQWLDIRHTGLGWWERLPLLLELDRGTGSECTIRTKVRKYLQWTSFGYTDRFGAGDPRVVFVTPGNVQRAAVLKRWLEAELTERGARSLGGLFWVTSADAAVVTPEEFFFGQHWQRPFEANLLPLFVPGQLQESQAVDYLYAWGMTEADLAPQVTLYERPRYVTL